MRWRNTIDRRAFRVGDDEIGQPVAIDVPQRKVAPAVAGILPAESGLYQAGGRIIVPTFGVAASGIVGFRLAELKDSQPAGLGVDREDFATRLAVDLGVGNRARPVDFKLQLGAQSAGIVLQPCTEGAVLRIAGDVAEVFSAVSIQIGHLREGQLFGRVHQYVWRSQAAVRLLKKDIGLLLPENDEIVLPVAVEVAGGHVPLRRRDIGNPDRRAIVPIPGFGLKPDHQSVRHSEGGDVDPSVAVEIAHRHRSELLVERNLLVLEPRVAGHFIDARASGVGSRFGRSSPLQQQVDRRVTVVEQSQVGQSVVVEVAGQHVARSGFQLVDLDRLEAVIRGQIDGTRRLRLFISSGHGGDHHADSHRQQKVPRDAPPCVSRIHNTTCSIRY